MSEYSFQVNTCAVMGVTNVFSGVFNKSEPFVFKLKDKEITLTLSCTFVPSHRLNAMHSIHTDNGHARYRFARGLEMQQVAIFAQSSTPIDFIPELALIKGQEVFELPTNWFGRDGKTRDKMFFGATRFMDNDKLAADYVIDDSLIIVIFFREKLEEFIKIMQRFEDGTDTDTVLFSSDGKEVEATKSILGHWSPAFKAMFEHKTVEAESGRVNIRNVEYEPLLLFVKYMYTEYFNPKDVDLALKVFVVADQYLVQKAKQIAEDFIVLRRINDSNVMEAFGIGKLLCSTKIKTACYRYVDARKMSDPLYSIPGVDKLYIECNATIEKLFDDKANADMLETSNGEETKDILQLWTLIFLTMCEHRLKGTESGQASTNDDEGQPHRSLVKFMNTGQMDGNDFMFALKLFVVLDRCGMQKEKKFVEAHTRPFVRKILCSANLIEIFRIGKLHSSDAIKFQCYLFIAEMKRADPSYSVPGIEEVYSEWSHTIENIFENGIGDDTKVRSSNSIEITITDRFILTWGCAFSVMFLHNLGEEEPGKMHPVEVECKPLPAFVKYFQTGQIAENDFMFALKVFVVADMCKNEPVKKIIGRYIDMYISNANVIEAIQFANKYNSTEIETACCKFLAKMDTSNLFAIPGFEADLKQSVAQSSLLDH